MLRLGSTAYQADPVLMALPIKVKNKAAYTSGLVYIIAVGVIEMSD
jgi:hypothetical protein